MPFVIILPLMPKQHKQFNAHVDRSGGPNACWPWTGSCGKKGYGAVRFSNPRRIIRAHRAAYAIKHGVDPGELLVCHKCDNPPCCNPKHLFLGTQDDNSKDKTKKGRAARNDNRGEKNGNATMNSSDAEQVKRLISQGFNNTMIGGWFGVTHSMISAIRRGKAWGGNKPLTGRYESLKISTPPS